MWTHSRNDTFSYAILESGSLIPFERGSFGIHGFHLKEVALHGKLVEERFWLLINFSEEGRCWITVTSYVKLKSQLITFFFIVWRQGYFGKYSALAKVPYQMGNWSIYSFSCTYIHPNIYKILMNFLWNFTKISILDGTKISMGDRTIVIIKKSAKI